MSGQSRASRPKDVRAAGRVAVIDIGSNTVRMVVYDAPTRLPFPMFNEKVQCSLGRGLASTGKLNPDGVEMALHSIGRFISLGRQMGVERVDLVATAAVREAMDGPDFVQEVTRLHGVQIDVISGAEEARLAAMGLLSGVPDADGFVGDLGGGSLDLVALNQGEFGDYATLPLGHLRLAEDSGWHPRKTPQIIASHLDDIGWLDKMQGRTLYAVGGAWRTIARVFIDQTDYPLHVLDGYSVARADALQLLRVISNLSPSSLKQVPGIPKRRIETMPYAALSLAALIETARPKELVFSGFGMREGQLIKTLPDDMKRQDPLISGCAALAERTGRFSIGGGEILDWLGPVLDKKNRDERRLWLAASLLSDIGWGEHPDYRADHAFRRALRLPFAGMSHRDRVYLAVAVFVRYNGDLKAKVIRPVRSLLSSEEEARAETLGLALRLAHTLSGSAPGLLIRTRLRPARKYLHLEILDQDEDLFVSEAVLRRFKTLARNLGFKAQMDMVDEDRMLAEE